MARRGVSGLVVVDAESRAVGILTHRDMVLRDDEATPVRDIMTPRERMVTGGPGTTVEAAAELLRDARVEKLPLVDEGGRLVGLITLKDLLQRIERPDATKDARGRLAVGAAIGVRGDFRERARALAAAGADAARARHRPRPRRARRCGRSARCASGSTAARTSSPATSPRPRARATWCRPAPTRSRWASGPGSVCTTRVVAGVGVPQLSAVMACAEACAAHDVPVIADGGIRAAGDVAKAIAAGAETVMVGNLLAGTPESPGDVVTRNGSRVKVFRGMASARGGQRPAGGRGRRPRTSRRWWPRASRRSCRCATRSR